MADPVEFLSPLAPWSSPTWIPPGPHNLPKANASIPTSQDGGASVTVRENHRYASIVDVNITVGTASFKFLDQPIGKRNFLGFRNASTAAQVIYIGFNGPASSASWLSITAGTIILFDTVVPQDDLYVAASAAGASFSYAYSTIAGN